MTEKINLYSSGVAQTVEAFKNRPCSLPPHDPNFVPPTKEEIKSLRTNILGFTQVQVAMLLGDKFSKSGAQSVMLWEKGQKKISNARWRLLLVKAKVIDVDSL